MSVRRIDLSRRRLEQQAEEAGLLADPQDDALVAAAHIDPRLLAGADQLRADGIESGAIAAAGFGTGRACNLGARCLGGLLLLRHRDFLLPAGRPLWDIESV